MKYRLTDFPATLFAVVTGIFCALFGSDTVVSMIGSDHVLSMPPVLALVVVIVTTIVLQMYLAPSGGSKEAGFLKAYFVRSLGVALTVGVVGFVGGMVERAPALFNQHLPCSGVERC